MVALLMMVVSSTGSLFIAARYLSTLLENSWWEAFMYFSLIARALTSRCEAVRRSSTGTE